MWFVNKYNGMSQEQYQQPIDITSPNSINNLNDVIKLLRELKNANGNTRINTVKQAIDKAYEVLSTENDTIIQQFSNYEDEIIKLKAMKFDEQMVHHNTSQNKPSFSSIVKRQPNLIPEQFSFKNNSNVIMIVPKNEAILSPRALEIDIKKKFKPSDHNIKINKTFSTAKGLGLVFPTDQPKSINQIINVIEEKYPNADKCNVYQPQSTLPTIVVHGINKAKLNLEEIVDVICEENPSLSLPEGISTLFQTLQRFQT